MASITLEKITSRKGLSDRFLAQSISKGTIFGVVASLVRFGTRLILVPIFISHLGLGGYGIWATLMVIAGYLRFGSGGVKTCFQKYVAEATESGEFDRANQLLTTGSAIFVAIAAAMLIPIAIFPRFLAHLVGIPLQYMPASSTAITLLAIAYLVCDGMAALESAVLGAHRVDLMQYFSVSVMICEMAFYVVALRLGYGLTSLVLGLTIGEVGYAICGLLMARRVIPQISLRPKYLTTKVIGELVSFTGSHQLLNLMELFYFGIVPIVLLRELGVEAAAVFAICDRLTRFATTGLESSLVPLLSGSTVVFSTGSSERMQAFLLKVFKMSLIATMLPLAFASVFGPAAVLAWTGQTNGLFRLGILLVGISALFRALSRVGMIMYRSTGGTSMDNWAQLLRILILLLVVVLGRRWGFYGALSGLALAELAGMILMLEALFRRLSCFSLRQLFWQAAHFSLSVMFLIVAGEAVARIPLPFHAGSRLFVSVQLCIISLVTIVLIWPAFIFTKYFPLDERIQILGVLLPWRRAAKPVYH